MTAKWVPEVGEECEWSVNGVSYEDGIILFNDGVTILIANRKYPANRRHYKFDDPDLHFRPLQTEAEKYRDKQIEQFKRDAFRGNGFSLADKTETAIAIKAINAGWVKPEEGEFVARKESKLEWSKTLCNGKEVTYVQAEKACTELGEGWRLPTINELLTLVDHARYNPAIDTDLFPDTESDWYWTSTETAWNTSAVWIVHFNDGHVNHNHRLSGACVRAVRASQ